MSILSSATPEQIIKRATERLELQENDLAEPNEATKKKIRNFTRVLQKRKCPDVIKHLRDIVPAGTTG